MHSADDQLLQMDASIARGLLPGGVSVILLPARSIWGLSDALAASPISSCMATPAELSLVGDAVFDRVCLCPRARMLTCMVCLMQGSSTLGHLSRLINKVYLRGPLGFATKATAMANRAWLRYP